MGRPRKYSPEVRERAVRLVFDHEHQHESQWAAIRSVAEKIECTSAGSADVAADLLQDAFLRFLRVAPEGLDPSHQKAYLYKIASRLVVDHWRRVNREQRWDWKPVVGRSGTTDPDVEQNHDVSEVFRTLKALFR